MLYTKNTVIFQRITLLGGKFVSYIFQYLEELEKVHKSVNAQIFFLITLYFKDVS